MCHSPPYRRCGAPHPLWGEGMVHSEQNILSLPIGLRPYIGGVDPMAPMRAKIHPGQNILSFFIAFTSTRFETLTKWAWTHYLVHPHFFLFAPLIIISSLKYPPNFYLHPLSPHSPPFSPTVRTNKKKSYTTPVAVVATMTIVKSTSTVAMFWLWWLQTQIWRPDRCKEMENGSALTEKTPQKGNICKNL